MPRALLLGIVLWLVGTVGIRLGGQALLSPDHPAHTLLVYAVSFVLMFFLIPRVCRRFEAEKDARLRAAALLILPTLILDPFSCLYFAHAFPNINPASAGAFGGWMLICCAGALVGVWIRP
jgi:hypothetical protein